MATVKNESKRGAKPLPKDRDRMSIIVKKMKMLKITPKDLYSERPGLSPSNLTKKLRCEVGCTEEEFVFFENQISKYEKRLLKAIKG